MKNYYKHINFCHKVLFVWPISSFLLYFQVRKSCPVDSSVGSNDSSSGIFGSGDSHSDTVGCSVISHFHRSFDWNIRQLIWLNLIVAVWSLDLWQLHWLICVAIVVGVVLIVAVDDVVRYYHFAVASHKGRFLVWIYGLGTVSVFLLFQLLGFFLLCLVRKSQSHCLCHFPHLLVPVVETT